MKFEVTSFITFEVMPQTRFRDALTDRRTDRQTDGHTDRVTLVYPPELRYGGIKTLFLSFPRFFETCNDTKLNRSKNTRILSHLFKTDPVTSPCV